MQVSLLSIYISIKVVVQQLQQANCSANMSDQKQFDTIEDPVWSFPNPKARAVDLPPSLSEDQSLPQLHHPAFASLKLFRTPHLSQVVAWRSLPCLACVETSMIARNRGRDGLQTALFREQTYALAADLRRKFCGTDRRSSSAADMTHCKGVHQLLCKCEFFLIRLLI